MTTVEKLEARRYAAMKQYQWAENNADRSQMSFWAERIREIDADLKGSIR